MTPYDTFRHHSSILLMATPSVGDVGYIREGKFHHLFSAMLPENHLSHLRLGVPEYHEQLSSELPIQSRSRQKRGLLR